MTTPEPLHPVAEKLAVTMAGLILTARVPLAEREEFILRFGVTEYRKMRARHPNIAPEKLRDLATAICGRIREILQRAPDDVIVRTRAN